MRITSLVKQLISKYQKRAEVNVHKRYMRLLLNSLPEKRYFTPEQKKEIIDYYKRLTGQIVNLDSHQYFYSRTGIYSKEYVPTYLYHVDLIGRANMMPYRDALADKNMCDVLLPDVKHPKTYLKNQNGYFYIENEPVSKEEAIKKCQNLHNMII